MIKFVKKELTNDFMVT